MFNNLDYTLCDSDEYRDRIDQIEVLRANPELEFRGVLVGVNSLVGSASDQLQGQYRRSNGYPGMEAW